MIKKQNIVLAYKGIENYVSEAKKSDIKDYKDLWQQYVIAPYWHLWAANQHNEQRIKAEVANPITDLVNLNRAFKILNSIDIEQKITEIFYKIENSLPHPEGGLSICVLINTNLKDNVHGVVGSCVGDNILISINPLVENWLNYLGWVIAHEYNHCIFGYNYYYLQKNTSMNVLTTIITEGLADSFAKSLYPKLTVNWINGLNSEQKKEQWQKIKSILFNEITPQVYMRLFFENDTTPVFTGYNIGFAIIQSYLKFHNTKFTDLMKMDSKEILEESNYC